MRFSQLGLKAFLFCLLFTLVSCSSVTIDLKNPTDTLPKKPSFSDYRSFYFWGMLQTKHLSLAKACDSGEPIRIRSYASLEDVLVTTFTLGLYTSRTLDVWCQVKLPSPPAEVPK